MVEVRCVAENDGKKIRARIVAYIDDDTGRRYDNVYDNTFNCQFPRAIRAVGEHIYYICL